MLQWEWGGFQSCWLLFCHISIRDTLPDPELGSTQVRCSLAVEPQPASFQPGLHGWVALWAAELSLQRSVTWKQTNKAFLLEFLDQCKACTEQLLTALHLK